jgi:hypothetical protein
MDIIPVDDRALVAPVTFVQSTTLDFVRADIGYMVWPAAENLMKFIQQEL